MNLTQFIINLFLADSGLSSKRVLSYIVAIFLFIYIFFNPVEQIVWILATLVATLQGLTLFQIPKEPAIPVQGFKQDQIQHG
jgi:hypothetical protein